MSFEGMYLATRPKGTQVPTPYKVGWGEGGHAAARKLSNWESIQLLKWIFKTKEVQAQNLKIMKSFVKKFIIHNKYM